MCIRALCIRASIRSISPVTCQRSDSFCNPTVCQARINCGWWVVRSTCCRCWGQESRPEQRTGRAKRERAGKSPTGKACISLSLSCAILTFPGRQFPCSCPVDRTNPTHGVYDHLRVPIFSIFGTVPLCRAGRASGLVNLCHLAFRISLREFGVMIYTNTFIAPNSVFTCAGTVFERLCHLRMRPLGPIAPMSNSNNQKTSTSPVLLVALDSFVPTLPVFHTRKARSTHKQLR